MDLVVFENNKPYVIDEFREGRFDYLELASDVVETKFFQYLFGQGVVDELARHYPSPRQRHHVPPWMYVSSQLSLRLHGPHSFHSYPFIIRAGGLIDALGPDVARREVDAQTGDIRLHCASFNDRNLYPRDTPCDQDYLRKLAKQTDPKELEDWYNRHVARLYGELGAYEEEGVFVGDGSYLFVPHNDHYEGSTRLLFDEHNHPVSKDEEQKMTAAQRKRCRWRRCYKVVFLLHCDRAGERFVAAGVRVLRANQAEAPALWELVDAFVAAVGRGVMKVLVVDRGFIDGPQMGRLKTEYGVDTVIPIRKNMDILQLVEQHRGTRAKRRQDSAQRWAQMNMTTETWKPVWSHIRRNTRKTRLDRVSPSKEKTYSTIRKPMRCSRRLTGRCGSLRSNDARGGHLQRRFVQWFITMV